MRVLFLFSISTLILLTISSCKKTELPKNAGIVGKWHLKEVFDGYVNGGNFQWHVVSIEGSHTLIFTEDNRYKKKENINNNNWECNGMYSLQNLTELEINSNCNTVTERVFISELTPVSMIIDRSGIEGKIRYRYQSLK